MNRPIIVDRLGERWLPLTGADGTEFYLPGNHKPLEGEISKPDWEWPGYPDRSFEGKRRR